MEKKIKYDLAAIEYIAKIADGGMRDAITLLDKCLSYSNELTVENVIKALGVADYDTMLELTSALAHNDVPKVISTIDGVYSSGVDLRQFVKTYFEFVLDCSIYQTTHNAEYVKIPDTYFKRISTLNAQFYNRLLTVIVNLQNSIKYEGNPKSVILATLILFMEE